jgi:hypothetical protein
LRAKSTANVLILAKNTRMKHCDILGNILGLTIQREENQKHQLHS